MKRAIRFIALLVAALLALAAVAGSGEGLGTRLPEIGDYFTERDLSGEWDATATPIELTGDTAVCASHVVSVEGGTITIADGGTYVLSGTLEDGSIVVDVKDDERVQLVLNGVSITSADSAAILVKQADKVFITLADSTENALINGGSFADEAVGAVIFSDEDLSFNGTGSLTISSPAGDGIDGKDDVKFASGTYVITAAGRGIDANDSVRIAGGSYTIVSGGDAIRAKHSSNESLGYVYIWDGSFELTAGGGAGEMKAQEFGTMGFGGGFGRGGMTRRDFEGSEDMTPPDYAEGEGMTPPEFSGTEGEDMTPPDFEEGGDMIPPDFAEGEAGMPGFPGGMEPDVGGESAEDEAALVSAKGIRASDDLIILGGSFDIDSLDDALHADGSVTIAGGSIEAASGDDGIHADATLSVLDGSINITQSSEGLEGEVIAVSGGDIYVRASDDGLNASGSSGEGETFAAQEGVLIDISGGTLYVNADGDGIDSNGDITISGGIVVVSGPENGANGSLDYNGTAIISGGTVIAAGASGMAENFSEGSTQAAFLVGLNGGAGTINVSDADGNVILSAELEKSYATVVVSSPELIVGETYTVASGEASAEITLTDTVTGADAGGMGGMGDMRGMGGMRPFGGDADQTGNEG